MDAIDKVKTGKLDSNQANAIAKLAGQVSLSLQVEANLRAQGLLTKMQPLGALPIGEAPTTLQIENDPEIIETDPEAARRARVAAWDATVRRTA